MISKNTIKHIKSLHQKKYRIAEQQFIIEGPKLVNELLLSSYDIVQLYATEDNWLSSYKGNMPISIITQNELDKITQFKTGNQVLAIVKIPQFQPMNAHNRTTLVLDGIQDPGNLGTIIRIADWFGIEKIIASEDTAEQYNHKVVQASMGSIFRVDIHYTELEGFLSSSSLPIYGAILDGENILQHQLNPHSIIIIGNESKGIRDNIRPFIQKGITIPCFGKAESLNASVATGIILSHMIR